MRDLTHRYFYRQMAFRQIIKVLQPLHGLIYITFFCPCACGYGKCPLLQVAYSFHITMLLAVLIVPLCFKWITEFSAHVCNTFAKQVKINGSDSFAIIFFNLVDNIDRRGCTLRLPPFEWVIRKRLSAFDCPSTNYTMLFILPFLCDVSTAFHRLPDDVRWYVSQDYIHFFKNSFGLATIGI